MLAFTASNHRGLFVDVLLSFWGFFLLFSFFFYFEFTLVWFSISCISVIATCVFSMERLLFEMASTIY